jgi:hypothetical protein
MKWGLTPLLLLAAHPAAQDDCGTSTGKTALVDLGAGTYEGFEGGLYPGGVNAPPPDHLRDAIARATLIEPRDASGRPDPERGLVGLVAIGLSTAAHEFGRFEREQDSNPSRNPRVVLVNGAEAGWSVERLLDPEASYWDRLDERLTAVGLSPAQVQVVWIKQRRAPAYARKVAGGVQREDARAENQDRGFPRHAELLRDELGSLVRSLRDRFPNLVLAYLSDRTYGGYARSEPACYEIGFGIRWLIADQIARRSDLNWSPERGPVRAPLLLWGPYLWADGSRPNGLGTRWCRTDYEADFANHPSPAGEDKVADLLAQFLAREPTAAPWFMGSGGPGLTALEATADAYVDAGEPERNFGSESVLRATFGDAPTSCYVRFDLGEIRRPVLHAKLSFRASPEAVPYGACEVFAVADDRWEEASLTSANAPELGESLGTLPRVSRDGTRALDVTAAVNAHGDTTLTLALAMHTAPERENQSSRLVSREGGAPPRLVLVPTSPAPPVDGRKDR